MTREVKESVEVPLDEDESFHDGEQYQVHNDVPML